MRKSLIAIALLLTTASAALVAQRRYLPDAPGTWKPWQFHAYADNRRQLAAKPSEVKALETQLLALGAIIRNTPGFAAPIGFSVETAGDLELPQLPPSPASRQPAITTLPLPATFNFGAYGIHEFDRGGKVVRDDTGETTQLLFFVNHLALPLFDGSGGRVPEFETLDADVALLPRPQSDLLGMPRYGDMIVLKRNPAPLWVAVPLEEALELATRAIQSRLTGSRKTVAKLQAGYEDATDPVKRAKRIADYKAIAPLTKDPAGYMDMMMKAERSIEASAATRLGPIGVAQTQVTAIERELATATAASAALTLAERAAPACYAREDPVSLSRFRRTPGAACVALVRPNWTFFNPALPRSAPQILVITHFSSCFVAELAPLHAGGCTANKRLLESIDQQALLAWLQ